MDEKQGGAENIDGCPNFSVEVYREDGVKQNGDDTK